MKIIFVCGVIKSGKDYYVEEYKRLHTEEDVVEIKFSTPIRVLVSLATGLDLSDKIIYEKWKSLPQNRQMLVDIGAYLKKSYNRIVFANMALKKILLYKNKENKTFIISDFRFPFETHPFETYAPYMIDNDFYVHFCNYKSDEYNCNINQHTEYMAQWLCTQGYQHNTHWRLGEFITLIQQYDDKERIN